MSSNPTRMKVIVNDITTLEVDAIVNAANARLLGGGGVDGAIHRAAGSALYEACRALPEVRPGVRCPTGEARRTPGFDLPAKYVIHTVGPVWDGGDAGESPLLGACYRNCLRLARETGDIRTIAFPAISTGVYGFPAEKAAHIAVETVAADLAEHDQPGQVVFCCFSDESAAYHQAAMDRLQQGRGRAPGSHRKP